MHKRTLAAATAAAATALASAVVAQSADAAPAARAVPHSKPTWVAHSKSLGHAKSNSTITARVYLAPNGGLAALKDAATAVSTPGSAQYHHFLTSREYAAKFGTTHASVKKVSHFITSQGLKVRKVSADNRYLIVSGSVAKVDKAFKTKLNRYHHQGQTVRAPASAAEVPASIASEVIAVTGLDTTVHKSTPASSQSKPAAPPPTGFRNARPCSLYYGQLEAKYKADYSTKLPKFEGKTLPYAPCGYTGPQFRAAYEGANPKNLDGTGVSVGIIDAYAAHTIDKDANRYASEHGDGSYGKNQLVQTNPNKFTHKKACQPSGWYGEETLDVEAVHAMAPGAQVHYYGAASCFDNDLFDAAAKVVKQDKVQIVTNSYGEVAEGESADSINAYEAVFLQGAVQGMSFTFSSGDDGDELASSAIKQADYPTSDPYVTSVGGTSTAIGSDGSLQFQTGWGTDTFALSKDDSSWTPGGFLYGAGGGTSTLFNQPDYQDGTTSSPYRQDPDVAMDADPNTGMLVGETQTFSTGRSYDEYRIGGTSLASPLFAGMTALAIQHAGGKGAGLLNPIIYAHQKSFNDVTRHPNKLGVVRVDFVNSENAKDGLKYSVRTFGDDSSLKTTKGYDLVTGVGTPNGKWLNTLG